MKSRPWGRKTPLRAPIAREDFRTRPVCVCTSAPAFTLPPSAFALPRPRSHFPRIAFHFPPRSDRHLAAAVIHNGLSTEKLSTSLLAALCKTFSPSRLRTRIYNISFARRPLPGVSAPLWERGRAVVARVPRRRAQGGGGRGQRRTPPRAVPRTCPPTAVPLPPTAESLCAKAEVHKVIPALPVRSPRVSPPKTEPPPADGRSAVRSSRDSLSTAVPPSADGRSAERRVGRVKAKADVPSRSNPHLPAYRRAPSHSNPPLSAYRPAPAV